MNENIAKITIGIISSFPDKNSVILYRDMMATEMKYQISDLSVLNAKAAIVISNIASFEKNVYIPKIANSKTAEDDFAITQDMIRDTKSYINDCVVSLNNTIKTLTDNGTISEGALAAYGTSDIESYYATMQNNDAMLLNFFSVKKFLIKNIDLLQTFTDLKTQLEKESDSRKESIVTHFENILKAVADMLSNQVQIYNNKKELYEAVCIAYECYDHYGWTVAEDAKNFVLRAYDEIVADIEEVIGE